MKIIELCNITKNYKNPVLSNLNYAFLEGKTYLVVGENGSGKTTLIKLILGLINPSFGVINKQVFSISYVPDNFSFPKFLSIYDFLFNLGLIYKIEKKILKETIDYQLNLWMINGDYKLNELSKGMRQKILIIQAMLNNGSLYIFDEPLSGLDQEMQELYFEEVKRLKIENKTIIIITHQINEFKGLYDYRLRIANGNLNEEFN